MGRANGDGRQLTLNAIRFAALRVREIETVLTVRCEQHGFRTLPDDDAGMDDLRLLLAHVAHFKDGQLRCAAIIRRWAPWLEDPQARENMMREALAAPPPKLTAGDLANRLGVDWDFRCALGLTTIGAAGLDEAAIEIKRRGRRADQARDRRRRQRDRHHLSSAYNAAHQRAGAVRVALVNRSWTSVSELIQIVGNWPCFAGLNGETLRRAINREIKRLTAPEANILEEKRVPSRTDIKRRLVRLAPESST